jgi:hypothetical protein
MSGAHSP